MCREYDCSGTSPFSVYTHVPDKNGLPLFAYNRRKPIIQGWTASLQFLYFHERRCVGIGKAENGKVI